jgi:hypothetical protein
MHECVFPDAGIRPAAMRPNGSGRCAFAAIPIPASER